MTIYSVMVVASSFVPRGKKSRRVVAQVRLEVTSMVSLIASFWIRRSSFVDCACAHLERHGERVYDT